MMTDLSKWDLSEQGSADFKEGDVTIGVFLENKGATVRVYYHELHGDTQDDCADLDIPVEVFRWVLLGEKK